MSPRTTLALVLLSAVAPVACSRDEPSPLEQCRSQAKGECCEDDECAGDSVCDLDYACSPAPGGGTQCSDLSGDRTCHSVCDESQEGIACRGGGTCTRYERAEGGDYLEEMWVCF